MTGREHTYYLMSARLVLWKWLQELVVDGITLLQQG